jgi:hypothetical protein
MQAIWCVKQPGHTLAVFLSTYAHLIADAEIAKARREVGTPDGKMNPCGRRVNTGPPAPVEN